MPRLVHAATIDEALALLAVPGARPIAGGVAVLLRAQRGEPLAQAYVAVARVPLLSVIRMDAPRNELVVGAAATLSEIAHSATVRNVSPLLATAAAAAASPGIRSIATLGGNLLDAIASSDLACALLAEHATVDLRVPGGSQSVDLEDLPATTVLNDPSQPCLLTTIRIRSKPRAGWSFQRLQSRGAGDRSLASVAVSISVRNGKIERASAYANGIAARPLRLTTLETALGDSSNLGAPGSVMHDAVATDLESAVLVDDYRGSAAYRGRILPVMVDRAIVAALARWGPA